ncbi:MAG TPA: hypothetical protein PKA90_11255 [Ignavibacteria bacterium]|nr:hypothetical protein [Ignavibacteria bacterium]
MENSHSLKSGKCPLCGSTEVYTDKDITQRGESRQIPVSTFTTIYFYSYICFGCGFMENHVNDDQLKNKKLISKIKNSWKKI